MTKAIRVKNVGKRYRLGELYRYKTIRESLQKALSAPLRKARGKTERVADSDPISADKGEELWALRDVSFDVEPGEVVGIIGRNGAGKSTLLKVLSRITEPTAGEVELYGRVSSLLEVGTGFHPELTGRENVYLNGSLLGMRKTEINRRFDEIVDFSGVERFLDTPVKRYSSGMQVRLAFAVAAHLEPEILLVDEVLAVGDAEFQRKCLGKMEDVATGGRTILFVSHNMAAVASLCHRGIVLEAGSVTCSGNVGTCIQAYLSPDDADPSRCIDGQYLETACFVDGEANGSPVSAIPMGRGVTLCARFRSPRPTAKPGVGVVFRRLVTGEPVFGVNTQMTGGARLAEPATQFEVTMTLDELNLVQGEYVLDLYLGDEHRNYEVLHGVLPLRITEADVFGTGRVPYSHTGPVYVVPKFEVRATD